MCPEDGSSKWPSCWRCCRGQQRSSDMRNGSLSAVRQAVTHGYARLRPVFRIQLLLAHCTNTKRHVTVAHQQIEVRECLQNLLSSRLLSRNLKIKIYRTIILPIVLYGCDTLSLTLREERRLMVFENRVLRRVFGPKTDEVTRD
jgi:hypothetical protein